MESHPKLFITPQTFQCAVISFDNSKFSLPQTSQSVECPNQPFALCLSCHDNCHVVNLLTTCYFISSLIHNASLNLPTCKTVKIETSLQ